MKYLEKLENFISDLNESHHFLGVMCCGTCAWSEHNESGYEDTFWILSDDLDNKPSQGVDLLFHGHIDTETFKLVIFLAEKNNLSTFLTFGDEGSEYVRIGVYSKRGKQEKKLYMNGKEIEVSW
jgi:hypothetical protein